MTKVSSSSSPESQLNRIDQIIGDLSIIQAEGYEGAGQAKDAIKKKRAEFKNLETARDALTEINLHLSTYINKETGEFEIPEDSKLYKMGQAKGIDNTFYNRIVETFEKLENNAVGSKEMPTRRYLEATKADLIKEKAKLENDPRLKKSTTEYSARKDIKKLQDKIDKVDKKIANFDKDRLKSSKTNQNEAYANVRKVLAKEFVKVNNDIVKKGAEIVGDGTKFVGNIVKQGVAKAGIATVEAAKRVGEKITTLANNVKEFAKETAKTVKTKLTNFFEKVKTGFEKVGKFIANKIAKPIYNGLKAFGEKLVAFGGMIQKKFGQLLGKFGSACTKKGNEIIEDANKTLNSIKGEEKIQNNEQAFAYVPDKVKEILGEDIQATVPKAPEFKVPKGFKESDRNLEDSLKDAGSKLRKTTAPKAPEFKVPKGFKESEKTLSDSLKEASGKLRKSGTNINSKSNNSGLPGMSGSGQTPTL